MSTRVVLSLTVALFCAAGAGCDDEVGDVVLDAETDAADAGTDAADAGTDAADVGLRDGGVDAADTRAADATDTAGDDAPDVAQDTRVADTSTDTASPDAADASDADGDTGVSCVDGQWRLTAPPDLRCCDGDRSVEPVCDETAEVWVCPPDTSTGWSDVAGCGLSRNVAEEGTPCGDATCMPGASCCHTVIPICESTPVRSCYERLACDGPEDCADGEVCCAAPNGGDSAGSPFFDSVCAATCDDADQFRLCNGTADCAMGRECCAARIRSNPGACLDECL